MGIEVLPIRGTDASLRLHPTRTTRALVEMARASLQVRRAARDAGADLVHANSIRAGLVATAAGRGGGPPTVVHVRDCLPPGRLSTLTMSVIGRADALIANSAYTRSALGRAGGSATVIHNPVDLARYEAVDLSPAQARERIGLRGEGPFLGVVAQITPWKAQDDAIAIAEELRRTHPGTQLLLVGSAKFDSAATRYDNAGFLRRLREQAAAAGLADDVHFLGEREDVPELLRALDVLLLPSWEEPFGRAIVEVMASGVPVAATEVGGPPEILGEGKDRCGLVLPPRRPAEWAAAIGPLLDELAELRLMGERGRDEAHRRFGAERHAAAVLDVYARVGAPATTGR